jgi:peroxiredoxin-like protein
MQSFPHHYQVSAAGADDGTIMIASPNLPDWPTAAPAEFDGPGDLWSPETMLVGAAANCFILTFRAIAKASKLEWTHLRCEAHGVLDRVDRVTQFTAIELNVKLELPAGGDAEKAERLLEKSERNCLITSSLKATVELRTEIEVAA